MQDAMVIRGAREHNLRNVNLELPRDKLIVFTGLSGSGKSSLVRPSPLFSLLSSFLFFVLPYVSRT